MKRGVSYRLSTLRFPLLALLAIVATCPTFAEERPNVLLILADDLGYHDLGCYGAVLYETPNLDRLAEQGLKFTEAYAACTVCSPTRAALLTGKYPARLHLTNFIPGGQIPQESELLPPDWTKQLELEQVTLAEALKAEGYVTGHFGKWHLNHDKKYRDGRPGDPGSQGFDDVLTTHKPSRNDDPADDAHHTVQITDRTVDFITRHQDQPFFGYVSYNAVHAPIMESPEGVAEWKRRIESDMAKRHPGYAAMIATMDREIGRLIAHLDSLGLAEETLVIFTSDNGGLESVSSNAPLRGGKGGNYEGGIKVPAIVRWSGKIEAGTTCDEPVSSIDWMPTILEASGIESASFGIEQMDGVSLNDRLHKPEAELGREALFWHYPHYHSGGATPHSAIRAGRWKLIETYEGGMVELYDLETDPGEATDLAAKRPEIVERLKQQLNGWRDEVDAQRPVLRK
ncbi:sulfatase [Stratiformator vulcanicus]|uniref:Arylsulfatase n=1 Tax=Stratiformator vulcanicus TaxID=2527980 RepID=A0A517R7E8_9PLAN|nr:sulfatase [Stratiformator vulcanicus]QDT39795.1 Arylsulfatase [Stratiformator vulcanicus]